MKSKFVLIISLFLVCVYSPTQAQWTQTNGPYGGTIRCFAVDGTTFFVGTSGGGVFRSSNNGKSWTEASTGLASTDVEDLAGSGSNLFAATWGGGVFRSTDEGQSWTKASTGLSDSNISAIVTANAYLFAGTHNDGVFLSTNNGISWSAVSNGLADPEVWALAIAPNGSGNTNLFAGTRSGVCRSTDHGANWTTVLAKGNAYAISVIGSRVFAAAYGEVYMSTDAGTTWTAADEGLPFTDFTALATDGTNLYAASYDQGVFLSGDYGAHWTAANEGLKCTSVYALAVTMNGSGATSIFAGTDPGGVFKSTNGGTTWSEANTGLRSIAVPTLSSHGTTLLAGTYGNGIYLSTDAGVNWTAANTGMTNTGITSFAFSDTTIYAGTFGGLFSSTNNGASWKKILDSVSVNFNGLGVIGPVLLVGTYGGVFRSTNNGVSWAPVDSGLPFPSYSGRFTFSSTNDGSGKVDVFAAVAAPGELNPELLYRSTDNGLTWTKTTEGLPIDVGSTIPALAVLPPAGRRATPALILALGLGGLFGWEGTGIFLSTDNGSHWSAADSCARRFSSLPSYVTSFAVAPFPEGNPMVYLFAGTARGGAFLSTDYGSTWTAVNSGLTNNNIRSLVISGPNLFAGTYGSGIWRRPVAGFLTGVKNIAGNGIPAQFSLEQNYPNPFNPATKIQFSIVNRQLTILKVYDLLGREVTTLVDEVKEPGSYEVTFDGRGLASGVYFYRLNAGQFTETKRLVLIR